MPPLADSTDQTQQQEDTSRPVRFAADANSGRPFSFIATSADTRLALHVTASTERMAAWAIPPQHDRARLGRLDQGPGSSAHLGSFWTLGPGERYNYFPSGPPRDPTWELALLYDSDFNHPVAPENADVAPWIVLYKCKIACERLIFVQNAVIHDGITDLSAAHITMLRPRITTDGKTASEYDHRETRPYSHTGDIPAWNPLTFVEDWGNNLELCYYHHTRPDGDYGTRSSYADQLIRNGQWPTEWPIEGKFLLYRNQYIQPFQWVPNPPRRGGYHREPITDPDIDEPYVLEHFETATGPVPAYPDSDDPNPDKFVQKLIHWHPCSWNSDSKEYSADARIALRNFLVSTLPSHLEASNDIDIREDTAFDLAIHADNYDVFTWHRINPAWYELDSDPRPWERDDWKTVKGTRNDSDYCRFYDSKIDIWVRQLAHCPPLNWPPAQEGGAA